MKSATSLSIGLILIGLFLFPDIAAAEQVDSGRPRAEQNRAAERLLRDGDPSGALAIYERIDPNDLTEIDHYNLGVALYQSQRFDESAEAFRKSAAASNPDLAARARFNLGNTDYARAVAAIDSQDPAATPPAMEALRSAIESYRSALRIAPADDDARFNLELANKLLRQLEQQQENQSQPNGDSPQDQQDQPQQPPSPSDEQNQQNESSSSENQQGQGKQQQDSQAQPNQGDSDQPPSEAPPTEPPDDSQPEPSDPSDSQSNQPQSGEQSAEQSQQSEQPDETEDGNRNASPSEDQAASQPSEDESSPSETADRPRNDSQEQRDDGGQPDQGADNQTAPEETPEGELTAANPADAGQASSDEAEGKPGQAFQMTQEEARKLLQAIRDRDMLRRLRRQASDRARQIPVERDW